MQTKLRGKMLSLVIWVIEFFFGFVKSMVQECRHRIFNITNKSIFLELTLGHNELLNALWNNYCQWWPFAAVTSCNQSQLWNVWLPTEGVWNKTKIFSYHHCKTSQLLESQVIPDELEFRALLMWPASVCKPPNVLLLLLFLTAASDLEDHFFLGFMLSHMGPSDWRGRSFESICQNFVQYFSVNAMCLFDVPCLLLQVEVKWHRKSKEAKGKENDYELQNKYTILTTRMFRPQIRQFIWECQSHN